MCDCLFNSPCCTLRYEDDSTTKAIHSNTFLIHVYVHSRASAVIVEVLNNECVISFCIQCPTHSMLESGQGPYQTTLGCREKYSAGINTPSRYCVHDGPRPQDTHECYLAQQHFTFEGNLCHTYINSRQFDRQ